MTALSRDAACDAYRKNCGGITVIERSAFESGWSARDAEVERLRAAIKAAIPAMRRSDGEPCWGYEAVYKQLREALGEDRK